MERILDEFLKGSDIDKITNVRAFLRDPKLLLPDEAAESLGSKSKEMLQLSLQKIKKVR